MSAACVHATLSLALEHCSWLLAASGLLLTLSRLLSMAGVKVELFRPINNDDRSGLPDEMPGGFHTHPSEHDLLWVLRTRACAAMRHGLSCSRNR